MRRPSPAYWSRTAVRVARRMAARALPVTANNEHFGKVSFMLQPGKSVNMGDGWETRRRREPGHDWAIVKLAATGTIDWQLPLGPFK